MIKTITDPREWQNYCAELRTSGPLGLVPTMGALHAGHISLVKAALAARQTCVVSIFVNPAQFNDPNDLAKYPRTIEADVAMLEAAGVSAVFLPEPATIYPDNYRYRLIETEFSKTLCGAHRPGHFDGVLTVVMKLLLLTRAESAYFGEKDYQQYRLIREMAAAFFVPTMIKGCPIVRETSGLAMSSRNLRLSPAGRDQAAVIYRIISSPINLDTAQGQLIEAGFEVEYLEEIPDEQPGLIRRLVAVWHEGVRLIDNVTRRAT